MNIGEFVQNISLDNIKKENAVWRRSMLMLGLIVIAGFATAVYLLFAGHETFGADNTMPWSLLISAYAFFVSSIGCCFVGSLDSVFGVHKYAPITKRAIFLAILIVFVGMMVIFVELGKPFRIFLYYILSPNPTSPLWWMGVNYTLYLIFIIMEYRAIEKNDEAKAKKLGILAFIAAVMAHSTVGYVFGSMQSRPHWYGPYMPIDFILNAWILGFAIMNILIHVSPQLSSKTELHEPMRKWLLALCFVNIFFLFWKLMTGFTAHDIGKSGAVESIFTGPLSIKFWVFEIFIGMVLPIILLISKKYQTIKGLKGIIFVSSIVIFGRFLEKTDIVDAGQIVELEAIDRAKAVFHKMTFSFSEICVVAGAVAFVILVYGLAEKYYFSADSGEEKKSK